MVSNSLTFSFVVIISMLFTFEVSGSSFNESLILGNYRMISHQKEPDYRKLLLAMEFAEPYLTVLRTVKLSVSIRKDNGKAKNRYIMRIRIPLMSQTIFFELGEPRGYIGADGRKFTVIIHFEDNEVLAHVKLPNDVEASIKSEMSPEGIRSFLSCKDRTAILHFKRVSKCR